MKLFSFHYCWQGIDAAGIRVEGTYQSNDLKILLEELKTKNITVIKISKKYFLFKPSQKIKEQDRIDFTRQLASLLDANIAITPALQIMQQSFENTAMKNLITQIKNLIEAGYSLYESLAKHPKYFNNFYCQLVNIGEQTGTLAKILQQIIIYQEKILQLKTKINKALLYPIVVIITAIIITAIMLIFVVPQFKSMFQDFGASLPFYTQIVIAISEKAKLIVISLGIIALLLFSGLKFLRKKSAYAYQIDKYFLQLPLYGNIIKKNILAHFARTLAITCNAGIPLTEALNISAQSCNNLLYRQAILAIHQQITAGQSIATAMQNSSIFPARLTQMIAIAEESGVMSAILIKAADYYEQQVDLTVESLIKLLEPALMIIMGIIVGGLIIAMYLPIFRLGNVI